MDVLRDVMGTGRSYHGADQLIRMSRTTDGEVEDRYFDFTY